MMRYYKRLATLAMVSILTISLCSCIDKDRTGEPEKKEEAEVTATSEEAKAEEKVEEKEISTTNYEDEEVTEEVKVVVDGQEITPEDNNGNEVETIIHNGVVYLPVKTIANATGRAYQWDGPNYTVYLGDMDGALETPTIEIENMTSISEAVSETDKLKDNYENTYQRAVYNAEDNMEFLVNMKYSRFKGTLYVPHGETRDSSVYLKIIADGKTIYTSPEMTRDSYPEKIDVDVTGYNDIKFEFSKRAPAGYLHLCLGDAGFYQ